MLKKKYLIKTFTVSLFLYCFNLNADQNGQITAEDTVINKYHEILPTNFNLISKALANTTLQTHSKINCQKEYSQINQKQNLDIKLVLGYTDGPNSTVAPKFYGDHPSLDRAAFFHLLNFFQAPCIGLNQLCEFKIKNNANYAQVSLHKSVYIDNQLKDVNITLVHSSYSFSYQKNITIYKSKQTLFSKLAELEFLNGINKSDVVFYIGHSRNGGGPDFYPPILNSSDKVDYKNYYRKYRNSLKNLKNIFLFTLSNDPIVGFFSCSSDLHFSHRLTDWKPSGKFILSLEDLKYTDALNSSIAYLEGILQQRCSSDLDQFIYKTNELYDSNNKTSGENNSQRNVRKTHQLNF